ncbi:MAG: GTPase Era [Spirochaetes bacterium]|nr:GTPase Era [Spirochaetota bacterium]
MSLMKKAAFVALVGRPSAGKSTLLNQICGEKVAIVSAVPQTTRNAIRGIANREKGQLVFVDTPGRHSSEKKFNKKLREVSDRTIADCDLVLYVLDASRAPGREEEEIAAALAGFSAKTLCAINKTDAAGADVGRTLEFLREKLPGFAEGRGFAVSALKNEGIEELLDALFAQAPDGDAPYGEEYYTDQGVEFRIAEIIREQAINRLRQELPHSLYVEIADAELDGENLWVRAFLSVERESQKGIVVGAGGEMIKAIRLGALRELKRVFDWKIELDLRVKTSKDWRQKDHLLRRVLGS